MPIKPDPDNPDLMVYVKREYNLPKKEWVNLTVEERETLRDAYQDSFSGLISAVQMLLKEKNT